ncbi:MAG: hypothetical protein ABI565_12695, partial [Vicinamibacteria bacterium]
MTRRLLSREAAALLPWIGAALLWFGIVSPMRADQANLLSQQSRTRRDRVKAERSTRETAALRERLVRALSSACRTSSDPAVLRQRAVAATAGLALSPFTLSVTGGTDGGAAVEASGSRKAALDLARRLGDPSRGGFLRSVTVRDKGARWSLAATTGVIEVVPADVLPVLPQCSSVSDPDSLVPVAIAPPPKPPFTTGRPKFKATPAPASPAPVLASEPAPGPPFTLVAFLSSKGKARVSVLVREEVRVVAVGETVEGWTCVSIDRDEGATFRSPTDA